MAARSLNKVMIIGNLTRDPELRYTPQGTAVCTFGIATNRQWTPADGGETQEEVEYHRIVSWAKLAEICAQILHKGRKVYLEGRLQTRNWTGQDGQERSTTEVVAETMIALGPPRVGVTEGSGETVAEVPAGKKAIPVVDAGSTREVVAGQKQEKPTKAGKRTGDKPPEKQGEDDEVPADDIPF